METLWYEVKYESLFKELERFSTTASLNKNGKNQCVPSHDIGDTDGTLKQVSYPAVWGLLWLFMNESVCRV